jgi:hypothetical protein
MLGRPKRDRADQKTLLQNELWWQLIFGWIRYGMVGGDDSIPIKKLEALTRINSEIQKTSPGSRLLDDKEIMLDPADDLPAEPAVWETLTCPRTKPSEILRLSKTSIYLSGFWNPWGRTLSKYAKEFCDSKNPHGNGKRYPGARADKSMLRPSSEDKRADYLARVLAGLSLQKKVPLSPATADRLLRDLHRKAKHGKRCPCWRCVCERSGVPDGKLLAKWRSMEGMSGASLFREKSGAPERPNAPGVRVAKFR